MTVMICNTYLEMLGPCIVMWSPIQTWLERSAGRKTEFASAIVRIARYLMCEWRSSSNINSRAFLVYVYVYVVICICMQGWLTSTCAKIQYYL